MPPISGDGRGPGNQSEPVQAHDEVAAVRQHGQASRRQAELGGELANGGQPSHPKWALGVHRPTVGGRCGQRCDLRVSGGGRQAGTSG